MKKLIFLFIPLLISCSSDNSKKSQISKLEFEGHTYLLYHGGLNHTWMDVQGLCHDENCKCKLLK